jgi:hypothetical protein
MIVYPVPVTVTQARIQLVADQTEKAAPHIINADVLDVFAAKSEAESEAERERERKALVDLKA